ncbi:hypothetical protein [Mycobacterium sp. TY815]|uniref:DUF7304 family protein n=1 Tax=Mycobacterium sp. TY815 TaxID=3050581 RepID=UPI00274054C7|nr:hypothetical protein [Mycobacterium sp. TY815]MDP7703237.1 hypothetical protein [Mycobacterium sp. TY815]
MTTAAESFSFYVDPHVIDCEAGTVVIGLGSVGDGHDAACIAASSGNTPYGDALLTREQLGTLIGSLSEIYGAMGLEL